jgi:parallel beta-helix repeat protein
METASFAPGFIRSLRRLAPLSALALTGLLAACGNSASTQGSGGTGGAGGTGGGTGGSGGTGSSAKCLEPSGDAPKDQKAVQTALIEAKDGDVICFAEGTFKFNGELELDVNNVTLQGAGQDKTLWDFSAHNLGGNGLLIKSNGVVVEELAVLNTPVDGIRADSVEGITFRKMSVIWDAKASDKNGAYGLYPVGSKDVLIEGCTVKGARDAGVYVGQSTSIVVKDNDVYGCVAGIEIENSTDAEVMNNHAHDNTAGILAFNLPGLPVQDGKRVKIHDNLVENNNEPNFGVEGTVVAKVPFGIGIMLLATDDNEVHNNQIKSNDSVGILTVSYLEFLFGAPNDAKYNSFPEGNFIHDNTFDGNGTKPSPLIVAAAGDIKPIPDIVWDGCTDPAAVDDGHLTNCINANTDGGGPATYASADLCGSPQMVDTDATKVTCEYDPLPPQK